jgi:hypothetical protein
VEHDPERIHVRRGADGLAANLLGAGVVRRQCAPGLLRQFGLGRHALIEQLGDAEVQ